VRSLLIILALIIPLLVSCQISSDGNDVFDSGTLPKSEVIFKLQIGSFEHSAPEDTIAFWKDVITYEIESYEQKDNYKN